MPNKLIWNKDFFSGAYQVYSNGQPIGNMKNRPFSQSVQANINGKSIPIRQWGSLNNEYI